MLDRLKTRLEKYRLVEKTVTDDQGNESTTTETVFEAGEDPLLLEMLESAKALFLSLRYPTTEPPEGGGGEPLIRKCDESWVVRAAAEMYNRVGAEGQTAHGENGILRSFDAGSVSESLRAEVTPLAGIARKRG